MHVIPVVRTLLLALIGACPCVHAADTPARVDLSLGSVNASSGVYAFAVALAGAVNKHDRAINVTAVEGGGGFAHARLMKQGVLDWSISGSPAVAAAVHAGTDGFRKEGAWEPIRLMFMRNVSVSRVYVRADLATREGIRSWSDLAGRPFSPGVPGTRDMMRAMHADKVLASAVRMSPASLADSVRRLKEGGIVGMLKGGPLDRYDAAMLEVHYGTPLTVIGFTREQAEKLSALDPLNTFQLTEKGSVREAPQAGPLYEMNSAVMTMASSRMSQDVGVRVMRAVRAGWKEISDAYPPARGLDPVVDAIRHIPPVQGLYLHAGVVQFAHENGIDVPARLIPPEYKPAR